jgi:hypothetical protein
LNIPATCCLSSFILFRSVMVAAGAAKLNTARTALVTGWTRSAGIVWISASTASSAARTFSRNWIPSAGNLMVWSSLVSVRSVRAAMSALVLSCTASSSATTACATGPGRLWMRSADNGAANGSGRLCVSAFDSGVGRLCVSAFDNGVGRLCVSAFDNGVGRLCVSAFDNGVGRLCARSSDSSWANRPTQSSSHLGGS